MKVVEVIVEDHLYEFYERVGMEAGGIPVRQVMSDALFKLAGELSLRAIYEKAQEKQGV